VTHHFCAEAVGYALRLTHPTMTGRESDSNIKQREDTASHSRGAIGPSFASSALERKRAQGKPGARCTRGLVCKQVVKNAHEHTGPAEASGFPCAMGYGLFRALPGDRAFLPPSLRETFASRELDASVGAPGPHGFAVRLSHARQSQLSR